MKLVLDGRNSNKNVLPSLLKTSFCLLSAVSFSLSSCTQQPSLSGSLTGVESDTLLVFSTYMDERKTFRTDTVALVNNHFELQYPDSAFFISIIPKPKEKNGAVRMAKGGPVLFFPGDKLTVNGSIDDFTVEGSELYDGLLKLENMTRLQDEVNELNNAYMKAYQAKDEAQKTRIKKEVKASYERLQNAKFEVVKNQPNTMVAGYFATQLRPQQGLDAIGMLSENVKSGPMAVLLQKSQESYERSLIREQAKEAMKPGNVAPDFKMTTIDGKEVTLNSFHGKYLLVDFWGTWCGWCVKGIPSMKKYYNKYKNEIEFLGVCCRDTDKKWRQGVTAYELPWVNVLEGESNLSARYAVGGYPTKVLLDPEGKIVEIFVGETPALYEKMDKLFGK